MAFSWIKSAALFGAALADHYVDRDGNVHLRLNPDGHFKIMQLTDLHFGENDPRDIRTE